MHAVKHFSPWQWQQPLRLRVKSETLDRVLSSMAAAEASQLNESGWTLPTLASEDSLAAAPGS